MDQLTLRNAKPAYEEGVVFARYLDLTTPLYRVVLGRRAADTIALAFTRPGHKFSFETTVFAERDGAIVGMISGYPTKQKHTPVDESRRNALGRRATRMRILTELLARKRWFLGRHAPGDFYVQGLAVDEQYRRQGVGAALIGAMEERARAAGSTRLTLNVAGRNVGARRLYTRSGLTAVSAWPKIQGIRPAVLRMAKILSLPGPRTAGGHNNASPIL